MYDIVSSADGKTLLQIENMRQSVLAAFQLLRKRPRPFQERLIYACDLFRQGRHVNVFWFVAVVIQGKEVFDNHPELTRGFERLANVPLVRE